MTKKEFLESEVFKMLPDDAEIVFATGEKLKECYALNALNISVVKELVNEDEISDIPLNAREHFDFKPKYKTCLVLDAIPYWVLREKYNIHLEK